MVSCSSGIARLLFASAFCERTQLHHHGVRPEDFVCRRVGEPHHVHVGDVAAREIHVVRVTGGEHQNLLAGTDFLEQRREVFGLRFLVFEGVHDYQRTLARARVQRRFLGELAHLLRNAEPVAARMRPMRDAAVPPMRGARRAGPPPSCWRPPRSSAEPQSWRLGPPCLRTVTRPFIGPGTEPRTNKRLRSASIFTTRRPISVKLRAPMCPGIRLPLMMRDGSVPGAMDPGLRWRVLPCVSGPPWK